MSYTKTTWVDEILSGAERFQIQDNDGNTPTAFSDLLNCRIDLATTITTPGTAINATALNKIETGIYDVHYSTQGLAVWGRQNTGAGDRANIVANIDGEVLRRNGDYLGFGQVVAAGIADDAITYTKIADNAVRQNHIYPDAVGYDEVGGGVLRITYYVGGTGNDYTVPGTTIRSLVDEQVRVSHGNVYTGVVSPGSSVTKTIQSHGSVGLKPNVFCNLVNDGQYGANGNRKASLIVHAMDTNGEFDVTVYNNDTANLESNISWLVIGGDLI